MANTDDIDPLFQPVSITEKQIQQLVTIIIGFGAILIWLMGIDPKIILGILIWIYPTKLAFISTLFESVREDWDDIIAKEVEKKLADTAKERYLIRKILLFILLTFQSLGLILITQWFNFGFGIIFFLLGMVFFYLMKAILFNKFVSRKTDTFHDSSFIDVQKGDIV